MTRIEELILQRTAIDAEIEAEYKREQEAAARGEADAQFNLGIIYYNQAVDIINAQIYNIDFTTLAQIQDECIDLFKKALPFAQKAYELDPTNKNVLEMLSGIHFGLNDLDKSNQFKAELENLKK